METLFHMDYRSALLIYAIFVAAYVLVGGIKGIMYTDFIKGSIMIFGALFLIFYSIYITGGIGNALETLNTLKGQIPPDLVKMGHQGWTSMPVTGSPFWWILISSLTMGVGIGVVVQPQLVVRYMMVKSSRELNRSLIMGSIFILILTGGTYYTGTVSNVFFQKRVWLHCSLLEGVKGAKGVDIDKIIPFLYPHSHATVVWIFFMLTIHSAAMSYF